MKIGVFLFLLLFVSISSAQQANILLGNHSGSLIPVASSGTGAPISSAPSTAAYGYNATGVAWGQVISGINATGTAGQSCLLTAFNNSSTATATVYLTGVNTIDPNTPIHITASGSGATAAPTAASVGSGTATCSGTAVLLTGLGAYVPLAVDASGNLATGSSGTVNSGTSGQFAYYGANGTTVSGIGIAAVAPSADTTGATDNAAIQAQITAAHSVHIGPGTFYYTGFTLTAPASIDCDPSGNTLLLKTTATGDSLNLNWGGGTFNNESLPTIIRNCVWAMKGGVTPTSGDVLNLSGVDATHNLSGVHFENNSVLGLWGGIRTGNFLINNWFENNLFLNIVGSDGCFYYNTPAPYGDNSFIGNQCTGSNSPVGLTVATADTFTFAFNKLNGGAHVVFARTGPAQRIVFEGNSIEGVSGNNCAVDFGTTGSNAPTAMEFNGGGIGLFNYNFCDGATVTGATDANYTVSATTLLYPNTGYGVRSASGQIFNQLVSFQGGTIAGPAFTVPSAGSNSAPNDYATAILDGTINGTNTGTTSSAGFGFRTKVTGTQHDWTLLAGNGTTSNMLRVFDNGNAGTGGASDVMDFLPGGSIIMPAITGHGTAGVVLSDASGNISQSLTLPTGTLATTLLTATNCAVNSVSPAACGSAAAGAVVVPTATTTYTVNTTAVTASSRIFLFPMSFASNLPSTPTCVVPAITAEPTISAITASTSFTFSLASTTGQTCWSYLIVN